MTEPWVPIIVQGLTLLAGTGGVSYGIVQLFANRKKLSADTDNTGASTLHIANTAIAGALVPLNTQIEFLGRQLTAANLSIDQLTTEGSAARSETRTLRREFDELRDAVLHCEAGRTCPVRDALLANGGETSPPAAPEVPP